jgi:hypothetical protein
MRLHNSGRRYSDRACWPQQAGDADSVAAAQHAPCPGQQQLPVAQQLALAFAAGTVRRADRSQHAPAGGQQQLPVTQQLLAAAAGLVSIVGAEVRSAMNARVDRVAVE